MTAVSHQTIKLSRGRHSSPEHGACVMELASMLAGEGFSDHPRSVSRPIASFLRGYNDLVDDRRREDLVPLRGSGGWDGRLTGGRGRARGATARLGRSSCGSAAPRGRCSTGMRLRRVSHERSADPEPAGTYAVHAIGKVNDDTPRRGARARRRADRDRCPAVCGAARRQAAGSAERVELAALRRARRAPCARAGGRCPARSRAGGRSRPAASGSSPPTP